MTTIDRPFPVPDFRRKRRALSDLRTVDGANLLDRLADAFGDRPALFDAHGTLLSYAGLRTRGARLAGALRDSGLEPGDAVAVLTRNGPELAVGVLGALRAGLEVAPLSPRLTSTEVASALKRIGARGIVVDAVGAPLVEGTGAEWILHLDDPEVTEHPEVEPASVLPADPALVFFTSGTTGEPKAATIPHRAVTSILRRYLRISSFLPTPRRQLILLVMPLAHTAGLVTLLTCACLGAPCLVHPRFDATDVLETIEVARPTVFAGSPAMYELLFRAGAEGYDLSSIRVWGGGADVFHRDLLQRLRDLGGWRRFGVPFKPFTVVGYGSSETTGPVTISPPVPVGDRCIGWVLPSFEHRIVDEHDADVDAGGTGELLLRGRSLMTGYVEDPEETGHDTGQRWFRTGDLVRRGRLGLLHYEGRHKDVITSGGYTIPAREIEAALEGHADVARAVALGLPDDVLGERPVAVVVLREGATATPADLHAWADTRLASYKRPREIHLADEIPLTSNLKPRKAQIREGLISPEGSGPT